MAKWSRVQIAVMARASGWGSRSEDVSWVAMSESGGDDKVVNSIGCVGLLQINQPVHVKSHPTWTVKWLQNPMNNLAAGKVLFDAAGGFDGPWADSKTKGGIPEGWGPHVTGGGGGGASQVDTDPCEDLKGTPAYDYCKRDLEGAPDPDNYGESGPGLGDTAAEIGRLAQVAAKAANWLADPANWLRIGYVVGGGFLAVTAVSVILQPYASRGYRQTVGALPVKSTKRYLAYRAENKRQSAEQEEEEQES